MDLCACTIVFGGIDTLLCRPEGGNPRAVLDSEGARERPAVFAAELALVFGNKSGVRMCPLVFMVVRSSISLLRISLVPLANTELP